MIRLVSIVFGLLVIMVFPGPIAASVDFANSYEEGGEDPYRLLSQAENLYQKDPAAALDLIEEALLMAIRQNNLDAQGASYDLLGDINFHLKQYDLAAANYQRALSLYKRTGKVNRQLELLRLAGDSYEKSMDLDKALVNYRAYVSLAESTGNTKQKKSISRGYQYKSGEVEEGSISELESIRLAITEILIKQEKFEESVRELDDVAEKIDTATNPEKSLIVNDMLGKAYIAQDMEEAAEDVYSRNASTARKLNKPVEEAKATSNLADLYDRQELTEEALKLRNRSIEIYGLSQDSINLARQYLARGKLQKKINQTDQAEESFQQALNFSIQSGDKQTERETYNEVSGLEEERGRITKALEYYKKYVALQDEAFREKQLELERSLELNSSLNKQQQRIDLLEKNEEISAKTIDLLRANQTISEKSTTNQRLLIYGLLLVILLLSISGYLMYNNMQRKRIANQLLALKSLRSQMNPHFIFNALNSVNHYISKQDERAANKYLSDFSKLMRSVLENSQEDFISLAEEIDILKLYLKLEHNRFSEKFDYEFTLDESLNKEQIQIPPMLVQPYVENAIWHGLRYRENKGFLSVKINKEQQQVFIEIEDNGIGRKRSRALKTINQQKNESTGMNNIEHRVEIINRMYATNINAKVIDLPDDSGTRIELRVPEINTSATS